MKLFAYVLLSAVLMPAAIAQTADSKPDTSQVKPSADVQKPTAAPKLFTDADTDPTQNTDDPTLLKAQVLMLNNASQYYRAHLSQIEDFQKYEDFRDQAEAKKKHLREVVEANQAAVRNANLMKQKSHAPEISRKALDAEIQQAAAANKAKAEAAAKEKAAATETPKK